jgi:hypothetical protein
MAEVEEEDRDEDEDEAEEGELGTERGIASAGEGLVGILHGVFLLLCLVRLPELENRW